MKNDDLIPADFNRCQCEITPSHGPFVLGPRPKASRCQNKPDFIAVEIVAGADGKHGEMSLCVSCGQQMLKHAELRKRVQLQPIIEKSSAA